MPSEARFIVKAIPDQTAVAVFTPSMVSPAPITEALNEVSAQFQGSKVSDANFAYFPIEESAVSSRLVYGIAGLLDSRTKQPTEVLAKVVEAIKDALIARHFAVYPDD